MTPEYWPIVIVESPYAASKEAVETYLVALCQTKYDPAHPQSFIEREERERLEEFNADQIAANAAYARRACMDCLRRQEVPYASHLFFPQILDEMKPEERELGLTAGYALWREASRVVFYMDRGASSGMLRARARATELGLKIECRYLDQEEKDDAVQSE